MAILAAIDVEHAPGEPLTAAYELATAFDDELVVINVMRQETYDDRRHSANQLPEEMAEQGYTLEQARQACADQVRVAVDEVLDSYDRDRVTPVGAVGDPASEVLALARELEPRFLVTGGRRRAPLEQALFGSVSAEIVRKARPPVVAVRTD